MKNQESERTKWDKCYEQLQEEIKQLKEKFTAREHTHQVSMQCARDGTEERVKADFKKKIEEFIRINDFDGECEDCINLCNELHKLIKNLEGK